MKAQSLSRGELRLMLKNLTIGQLLKETSTAFKNHPATIYSQENIHYTYNELYNETGKVAKALLGLGIKKETILQFGLLIAWNGFYFNSLLLELVPY